MNDIAQSSGANLPYLEMGSGFVLGLSVGMVVKKTFKLVLLLIGVAVIAVFALEAQGIVVLNEASLDHTIASIIEGAKHITLWLKDRLSTAKVAGGTGAVAGFMMGLKMG